MRPDQWMASQMHEANYTETDNYEWIKGEGIERNQLGYRNTYRWLTHIALFRTRELLYKGVGA